MVELDGLVSCVCGVVFFFFNQISHVRLGSHQPYIARCPVCPLYTETDRFEFIPDSAPKTHTQDPSMQTTAALEVCKLASLRAYHTLSCRMNWMRGNLGG